METADDDGQGSRGDSEVAPAAAATAGSVLGGSPATPPAQQGGTPSPWGNSSTIGYLMAPSALVAILLLMHFHFIVGRPAWNWVVVFGGVLTATVLANYLYRGRPTRFGLHLRILIGAAAVTAVIYLTGWGPVLVGAYAVLALDSISQDGSEVWPAVTVWSLLAICVGQLGTAQGWLPSELPVHMDNAMVLMGTFVLVFVIRIAAAIMEKKEKAEASLGMSEDRFRSLIQNSSDTTVVLDPTGVCTYASPAVTDLLGFSPAEMVGMVPADLVHPDDRERVQDHLRDQLQSTQSTASIQFRMMRADGGWCQAEAVVANQLERPSVAGIVANIRDITERKEFEALLAHRALHDPLTGLANRQLFLDRAEQMLVRARREIRPVAAFSIDLDHFKDANDSLGHEAGDRLLQAVAGRFITMLRASDRSAESEATSS